jgi:beta-N-acetylhexosaminidase
VTSKTRTALVLAGVLLAAPGRPLPADDKADKVDVRGKVTTVTAAADDVKKQGLLGTLLVEGDKDKAVTYDKASVKVTDKTKIEKLDGKDRKEAKFEDIKKGARVEATFTGPVADSYPVQATARSILILEEAK